MYVAFPCKRLREDVITMRAERKVFSIDKWKQRKKTSHKTKLKSQSRYVIMECEATLIFLNEMMKLMQDLNR